MEIQICFSVGSKEENIIILKKLKALKQKLDKQYSCNYTIHSCHLPKKIVYEKGFDPSIADGLERIFGNKYHCEVKATSFEEAMQKMDEYRISTAKKVDRLIIVANQPVSNIAVELQYFTSFEVMCI